jgi:soluble lytic murein transglycosylase-like protein
VSVTSVVDRVAELQSMIGLSPVGGTGGTASRAAFADALNAASGTTGSPAAAPSALASVSAAAATSLGADVPYGAEITAAAQRHGLDPALLAGLIKQESGFDPNARSGAGAEGLTQLMPGTATGLGVSNPLDPAQAIEGGAAYLAEQLQRFGGDTARALAAYNAGPGAVTRFGGVPPYAETQNYVRSVQAFAARFRSGASVPATA